MSQPSQQPAKCNITFNESISESSRSSVYFGFDHLERPIAIKVVSFPVDPTEIDLAVRLRHNNIVSAYEVLTPGVCDVESVCILYELALYNLQHFINHAEKSGQYYLNCEIFAGELVEALGYLNQNGITHTDISTENILVKKTLHGESAMLADLGNCRYTLEGVSDDAFNLGLVIVYMFSLIKPYKTGMDSAGFGGDYSDYIRVATGEYVDSFEETIPFSGLLYGTPPLGYSRLRVGLLEDRFIGSVPEDFETREQLLNCIFLLGQLQLSSAKKFFYYLHNIYRRYCVPLSVYPIPDESPQAILEQVIVFTDYAYSAVDSDFDYPSDVDESGTEGEGTEESVESTILNYISMFSGVIRPATLWDTFDSESALKEHIKDFFNLSLYSQMTFSVANNFDFDIDSQDESVHYVLRNPEKFVRF